MIVRIIVPTMINSMGDFLWITELIQNSLRVLEAESRAF